MSFLSWCALEGNENHEISRSPSWYKGDNSPGTPDTRHACSPANPTLMTHLPAGSVCKSARDRNLDRTPTWARERLDFGSLSDAVGSVRGNEAGSAAADLASSAPPQPVGPATEDTQGFPQSMETAAPLETVDEVVMEDTRGSPQLMETVTPLETVNEVNTEAERQHQHRELALLREEAERERRRLREEAEAERRRLQEEAEAERRRLQEEAEQTRMHMQGELDRERARRDELARLAAREAEGRRRLETQIERERRVKEEAEEARELGRMRAEEERQRALEAARAAAQRRIEEESRLAARAAADTRAREEAEARERARLHTEAQRRSERARQERESKERVRAFLAQHGHRHVRAKTARWTTSKSYPLHRAVREDDPEMVRLLLQVKADPTQTNARGLTPLSYARSIAEKGSGKLAAVIALLEAPDAAGTEGAGAP